MRIKMATVKMETVKQVRWSYISDVSAVGSWGTVP